MESVKTGGKGFDVILNSNMKRKDKYVKMKRILDAVISGVGLVFITPVIAVASAAIMLDDPKGSPIYTQERIGKDNKPFKIYKLRTMYKDADKDVEKLESLNEMDGPVFKIKDDPRITKVGKFLRKTNLDELPQFFNVFRGDMALVGPRPALPKEVIQYEPWQLKRLSVTPGITCYWQIAENRNDISFVDWMKMDIEYIKDMCFFTDLKILFRTAGSVIKMTGR